MQSQSADGETEAHFLNILLGKGFGPLRSALSIAALKRYRSLTR